MASFHKLLRDIMDLGFRGADRLSEGLPQGQIGLRGHVHVGRSCIYHQQLFATQSKAVTSSIMTRDRISILRRGGAVAVRAVCHGCGGAVPRRCGRRKV